MESALVKSLGNTYKVLPEFISAETVEKIKTSFFDSLAAGDSSFGVISPEDYSCVRNAVGIYMHSMSAITLCDKLSTVSEITGRDCLPSYCYTRLTKTGGTLNSHRDRPSCEITVSVHISGDEPWYLSVENIEGNMDDILLNPGDAVIMDGCNHEHIRLGEYKGTEYLQMCLHYIFVDGEFKQWVFDSPALFGMCNRI